jgi:hypothetical protein
LQEPIGKRVKPLISNSISNTFSKPKQASFSLLTFYLQSHPKSKQISQYFYQYSGFNHFTEKSLILFYRIKKDSNEFYGTGLARFLFRSNKLFYIVKFSQVRFQDVRNEVPENYYSGPRSALERRTDRERELRV